MQELLQEIDLIDLGGIELMAEPTALIDVTGAVVESNRAWRRLNDGAANPFETAEVRDALGNVLVGNVTTSFIDCGDDRHRIQVRRGLVRRDVAVVTRLDRNRQRALDQELSQCGERFEQVFLQAPIGMAIVDLLGTLLQVNDALCAIIGRSRGELVGARLETITDPADVANDVELRACLLAGELSSYQIEKRYRREDGGVVWVLVSVAAVCNADGEPLYIVKNVQDITDRKRAEAELAHTALHDPLTDLPNRILFTDRLRGALARAERRPGSVAVLYVDLDGFKSINDSLGHYAGDAVLVQMAERLRGLLRPGDTVARLGGDEFAMCCEDISDPDVAATIADRIAAALQQPMPVGGTERVVSASVGVALSQADSDVDSMIRDADVAMYRAKEVRRRPGAA
jgi:diguanylate cyclase (GGDEF)-like protein/PAS domain S-box-containing protein